MNKPLIQVPDRYSRNDKRRAYREFWAEWLWYARHGAIKAHGDPVPAGARGWWPPRVGSGADRKPVTVAASRCCW